MKKWSLNKKIYFIVCVMALGLTSVSAIGIYQMRNINSILDEITLTRLPNLIKTHDIMNVFYIQQINERNYVLMPTKDGREASGDFITKRHLEMEKLIDARKKSLTSEVAIQELSEFEGIYKNWFKLNQEIRILVDSGKSKEAAEHIAETGRKIRTSAEKILEEMNKRNTEKMEEGALIAQAAYENAKSLVITTSIFALSFGILLAYLTLKGVTKTIDEVIQSLSENSDQVTSAASQIAASSQELSQAVTEQASSLEETAASIEEMSSMVQKNADNANQATSIAGGSMDSAGKGQQVMATMINAIDDINTSNKDIMGQINTSNQQISEIIDVIKEIESKTKVINDIVFQTKLLSFNASVEAARAGEQGKGFAVVAEEIGSLAQMSGNAANEISVLLDNSINKVEGIVKETKEKVERLIHTGSLKVEMGTKIARECGDVLGEIVLNTTKVTKMTNEISTACQEQSLGVQEITRAMNQLDQVTQTNATTSEEAASAAEQLSAQALSLKNVVDLLVNTIKGDSQEEDISRHNVVRINRPEKFKRAA